MKIDFDIIFRPQIESGKYKVVTACGVPVEIVKWDCKGRCPILAVWEEDGTSCCRFLTERGSTENEKEWFYILTAQPEMTGFEKAFTSLVQYLLSLPREEVQDNMGLVINIINNYKDELLDAAAKQLGVDTGQARKDEDRPDPGPVPDSLWPKSVVDNLMKEVDKNTEVILRQFRESPWYRSAYSKGYTDGRSEALCMTADDVLNFKKWNPVLWASIIGPDVKSAQAEGREKALKDLPYWEKFPMSEMSDEVCDVRFIYGRWFLQYQGWAIDAEKLYGILPKKGKEVEP